MHRHHGAYKLIVGALFFSWAGDVLLLFERHDPNFFIGGLTSFLLAHVCYAGFFRLAASEQKIRLNLLYLLPIIIYYLALVWLLDPWLGHLRWPVRVYGAVICMMLLHASSMPRLVQRSAGWQMLGGALLFILSDSLLATHKFYSSFYGADLLIMLTYAFAQLLIVRGAAEFLRHSQYKTMRSRDVGPI